MLTERFLSPNIISSSAHQLIRSQAGACLASFCEAKTRTWENDFSLTKFNYSNKKAFSVTVVIEHVEMTLHKGGFDMLNYRGF